MNRKYFALISLLIILTFIGYIIIDTVSDKDNAASQDESAVLPEYPDMWQISAVIPDAVDQLTSVAVDDNGLIFCGGNMNVTCFGTGLKKKWSIPVSGKVMALAVYNDTVFASLTEHILLLSTEGRMLSDWGPYELNSIITSISVNKYFAAFADAGCKRIFILKKSGEVHSMIGQGDRKFIIPSPYFDVALSGRDTVYIADTGKRRIETWTTDGRFIDAFGEPGLAPEAFCGCCNPSHFTVISQGFITAEKGMNRIKITDRKGRFIEFVSSVNNFTAAIPLDIASSDGKTVYAANPSDSKIYIFTRK